MSNHNNEQYQQHQQQLQLQLHDTNGQLSPEHSTKEVLYTPNLGNIFSSSNYTRAPQPSYLQPSHQQPSHQQPSHQQPSHQQPSHQQPSHQQPSNRIRQSYVIPLQLRPSSSMQLTANSSQQQPTSELNTHQISNQSIAPSYHQIYETSTTITPHQPAQAQYVQNCQNLTTQHSPSPASVFIRSPVNMCQQNSILSNPNIQNLSNITANDHIQSNLINNSSHPTLNNLLNQQSFSTRPTVTLPNILSHSTGARSRGYRTYSRQARNSNLDQRVVRLPARQTTSAINMPIHNTTYSINMPIHNTNYPINLPIPSSNSITTMSTPDMVCANSMQYSGPNYSPDILIPNTHYQSNITTSNTTCRNTMQNPETGYQSSITLYPNNVHVPNTNFQTTMVRSEATRNPTPYSPITPVSVQSSSTQDAEIQTDNLLTHNKACQFDGGPKEIAHKILNATVEMIDIGCQTDDLILIQEKPNMIDRASSPINIPQPVRRKFTVKRSRGDKIEKCLDSTGSEEELPIKVD